MNEKPKEPLINYWYEALMKPHGIELITSNTELLRAQLYTARREAKDPDLEKISITISPFDPTKLWLRKKPEDSSDAT